MSQIPTWARAHGKPLIRGVFRAQPDDFYVEEQLPFELSQEGEHWYIFVEKTSQNTDWVSQQIALVLGISPRLVSYAGLKDRHAKTRQWFSVHLPGAKSIEVEKISDIEGVSVLQVAQHTKKLRRGCIQCNKFQLKLKQCQAAAYDQGAHFLELVNERLEAIKRNGVPNYFGEQRFGHEGKNISHAQTLFSEFGTNAFKVNKKKKGLYISAARSYLFNLILQERVQRKNWNSLMPGDLLMFFDGNTLFPATSEDRTILEQRIETGELSPTAPLWGVSGKLTASEKTLVLENSILQAHSDLCQGLEAFDLSMERRRLVLKPLLFEWEWDRDTLILNMNLPTGSYATSVIREMGVWENIASKTPQGEV